ncbi:MAG TPA: ANTAR domain-containing protein, partial [Acidimicrobiales bacterium]|nr:ANTAR domain-containing protein [Acidimicrobiales bacterium]
RVDKGDRAVADALATEPDVMVLDLMMPGLSGLEVARRVRAHRRIPIVAVTAYDDPALVEQAANCGVGAYLVKPVTPRQVGSALHLAVSRHSQFEAMQAEVDRLSDALETRKLVERAKGILMEQRGLSEAEAFARIQRRARDANRRMADVAREVIAADQVLG